MDASFLEFPLRIENGFVKRTGEVAAVLNLIQVMAATPRGTWAGCPEFGIRELLEESTIWRDSLSGIADRMNAALEDLGITLYRVIKAERQAAAMGSGALLVTIGAADAEGERYAVSVTI